MIKKVVTLLVAVVSVGFLLLVVLGAIVTRVESTQCDTSLCKFFSTKKPAER